MKDRCAVAVSLFGDAVWQHRYQPYFAPALRAHHNLFRGWTYRIYHDGKYRLGPYAETLDALADAGLVELAFVTADVMIEQAMLWRLLPLWDDSIDRFVIRDVDMVASWRERCLEETWIRSDLAMHAISDKAGDHNWPALNGMLGFRVQQCRQLLGASSLAELFARAKWSNHVWASNFRASGPRNARPKYRISPATTNNQYFLGHFVWPKLQQHALEHRLNGCHTYGAAQTRTSVEAFGNDDLGVHAVVRAESDALIPFMGASEVNSNINLAAIIAFYQKHGDPEIEHRIASCEAAVRQ